MSLTRGWNAQQRASNLAVARLYVKLHAPFLSSTLFGLIPTPMKGLREMVGGPLAVTERLVLYYEPEWVEQEEVEILATGLVHECLHVQLQHVNRGKRYADKERWNKAGDLFINSSMREVKRQKKVNGKLIREDVPTWKFPDWALMPEQFGFAPGLTADEYYRLLEEFDKAGKKAQTTGKPGPGKERADGSVGAHIMKGGCGGCAGNSLSIEIEGNLNNDKGRSVAEVHSIAKATAKAIKAHMESSGGRGTLPGAWSEFVDISDKEFDVPWRQKLANVTRYSISRAKVGGLDFSMRRPSKRSYLRGIRLPGLISYDPEVWFIVDSSGSMGTEQLADASKVVADVLTQTGVTHAWWMEADVEHKREPLRVRVRDLQQMEIRGRGGTDFRPAIKYVEERNPKPHIVVYITDGVGPAPEEPPLGIHFIWVIIPTRWAAIPARWGDMVVLTDHLPPMYQNGE